VTSGLSLRPTQPEDLPSLGALFSDRFGHGLSPGEWTWKYRTIPGEGRSLVAEVSGEVVAHAGALRLPARWRGGEAGVWTLVDFAGTTRRRGLRPALVELGRQLLADIPGEGDAPWIFGFPSERHFRLGERTFGYRPLTTAEVFTGEIPEVEAPAGVRIETGDSAGDWAEAIWESCGVLGVRRSAAFLNWRYWARPNRYYRFYRLFSGETEGFAVFSFLGEETWAAELWLPSGAEWYPSLLAVAADLRATGLKRWRFWGLPDARLGLAPTGERQLIGCRGREGGLDPVASAAGFTYSMGDWDFT
jgi:hypothetical protein